MDAKFQRPKDQEGAVSVLNETIKALDLAKISSVPSAKPILDSVGVLLMLIRVRYFLSSVTIWHEFTLV